MNKVAVLWRGLLAPLLLAYIFVNLVVRVGLWLAFRGDSKISIAGLFSAIGIGSLNDCVEFLYLAIPLSIVAASLRQSFLKRKGGRIFVGLSAYFYIAVFVFTAFAEVLFWEEFESRFNLIAVDYLIYPTEVVGNIQESYPVTPLLLG